MSPAELDQIERRYQPLLERETKAKELQKAVPSAESFVGVTGVTYTGEAFTLLPEFLTFRAVSNPPGVIHVCRAADLRQADYLGVSRYSHHVTAELALGCPNTQEKKTDTTFLHEMAFHTAALLKLRGFDLLACPASSTVSWDTVAAVSDNTACFRVLDDVPRKISLRQRNEITEPDLIWVRDSYNRALELRDSSCSRRFGLAFNIAYTWNHTHDPRVALGSLWCGLDALFGIQTDKPVTQKLLQRIATWLPSVSVSQLEDLYNHRCDAIHGRLMNDAELGNDLRATAALLRESLIRCVDANAKTLPDWAS